MHQELGTQRQGLSKNEVPLPQPDSFFPKEVIIDKALFRVQLFGANSPYVTACGQDPQDLTLCLK